MGEMIKQFLKMADEFSLPVKDETLEVYCEQHIGESFSSGEIYAAHAINSHDELVRQRAELLAALEAHEKFWTIREAELGELSPEAKAVRDNGLAAITAAKGAE